MPRGPLLVGLVGLLCLTAGCQGFLTEPNRPTTPVPVPTATESSGDAQFSTKLVERHVRALDGRSRTVQLNTTLRYPNGTVAYQRAVFVIDSDAYRVTVRTGGPFPEIDDGAERTRRLVTFRNETRKIRRERYQNGTVTTEVDTDYAGSTNISFGYRLASELSQFDLETAANASGTALSSPPTDGWRAGLPALQNGRNATVDGLVCDDRIRRLRITGYADHSGGPDDVRVTLDITVRAVGDSEPTPPPVANTSTEG